MEQTMMEQDYAAGPSLTVPEELEADPGAQVFGRRSRCSNF